MSESILGSDTLSSGNLPRESAVSYRYVAMISIVAALGGLLFGYDTAVVSGAIGFLQKHFGLTAAMKGWAASSALIGCIVGAAFAGMVNDSIGRKKTLILCGVLFVVSSLGTAFPQTLTQFVWARFLAGIAIGAVSMTSPIYIAEIAPTRVRGRLVSLYQLAIVTGIFVVFFVNSLIQRMGDDAWNTETGWRLMFGVGALPSFLFALLALIVPESPRWLVQAGRRQQAMDILTRVAGRPEAERQMLEIETTIAQEEGGIREIFSGGYLVALVIGVMLAVFQQFSGINSIMYYAPEIFKSVGSSSDSAFLQTVCVGAVNLIFTLVAVAWVDKAGRKALLIAGTGLQVLTLGAVGYLFHTHGSPWALLACILLYVAAFAAAMGPIVWLVIAEIFPNRVRGRAMSIAILALWAACYVVSQTFPILLERIGPAKTFWFYAVCSLLSMIFVAVFVPETKNRSLEEIAQSWRRQKH
ncbi:MAG: sugar porter family MFS transporter [Candidatus Sumerlaeaceae bacterium]